jgi:hypothetical protein
MERIKAWSVNIEGMAAADYLVKVIDAAVGGKTKPIPPWW